LLFVMGFIGGEAALFDASKISSRSIYGFLFLLMIGSTLGYTSYTWLLKVSTPARVSTYAYVNPVVALILGCTIGGETLTPRMMLAAGIVLVSVIIILTPRRLAPDSTQPAGIADASTVARECP
jgi:drug/metabolite transporter (DMT)-like permease